MNNGINLGGKSFLLARPEVKSKFNQHLNILMFHTPKNIWRPKVKNQYIPLDYSDDIEYGFFDCYHYGKAVFKPMVYWKAYTWNVIITYNHAEDCDELTQGLKIGETDSAESRERLISIIKSTGTVYEKGSRVVQSSGMNSRLTPEHPHLCFVKCQGTDRMNKK